MYTQDNGRTVLFYAATSGMLDLVEKLLEQGADLNIIDMVCYVTAKAVCVIVSLSLLYISMYRKENLL